MADWPCHSGNIDSSVVKVCHSGNIDSCRSGNIDGCVVEVTSIAVSFM